MAAGALVAATLAVVASPGAAGHTPARTPELAAPLVSTATRELPGRDVTVTVHADPRRALASRWAAGASANATPLASQWCGEERTSDDRLHESGDLREPKIKVIDAYPSDSAPQAVRRSAIQATIREVVAHVATESGQRRSLRYDLGTSCGSGYVDIQTVRLPRPTSAYNTTCPQDPIFQDVRGALDDARGPRDYIIFALDVNCGAVAGYAELPRDARPDAANAANAGNYMAVVFDLLPEYALHETGHNLGAVQLLSPHSDLGGHCWDEDDVMCYPYTSLLPRSPLRPCDLGSPPPWDCGHDDYFSPAPAAGSYLSNHWNTFNSAFMCPLATCAPPTFEWAPQAPRAGDSVTFTSGDQDAVASEWDFGDGAPAAYGAQAAHVYAAPGRYDVKLKVGSDGPVATATRSITVAPAELVATTGSAAPRPRESKPAIPRRESKPATPRSSKPPARRTKRRAACVRKRSARHTRKRCAKARRKPTRGR
jgi:PKD domain